MLGIALQPFETWPIQNDSLRAFYMRLMAGEFPHALLLVGSALDTAALARFLAQLILCEGANAPCGACDACIQFAAGNHPDYRCIDGSEGSIKTAEVEAVQEALKLRSHFGRGSVYVISDIDNATPVAANRLLKTLEEPEPGVLAVLTTTNIRRVLPTILSRCQVIRTGSASEESWEDPIGLRKEAPDGQEESGFAANLAAVIQWAERLFCTNEPGLALADALWGIVGKNDGSLPDILTLCSLWFRDVLHTRTDSLTYIQFQSHEADLARHAKRAEVAQLANCIQLVLQAKVRLQSHVAANLNVEQLCIRLREVFH